eukprot:COSAG06_NODE_28906_length_565_cov_10.491416_2_plen_83_part_00
MLELGLNGLLVGGIARDVVREHSVMALLLPAGTGRAAGHSMMALLLPAGTGRAAGRAAVPRPHRPMAAVGAVARVGAAAPWR